MEEWRTGLALIFVIQVGLHPYENVGYICYWTFFGPLAGDLWYLLEDTVTDLGNRRTRGTHLALMLLNEFLLTTEKHTMNTSVCG